MKLYFITSSCSLAPKIIMNELGISADFVKVIKKQVEENTYKTFLENSDDYSALYAKASVPALKLDDGTVLSENIAILQYLADTYNGHLLLPELGNFKRYRVLEWSAYIATELHKTFALLFYKDKYSSDVIAEFETAARKKLDFLNDQLSGKSFLVDNFTIADAYMFVVLSWSQFIGLDIINYPNIAQYYDSLLKIPSISKALQEEGLDYKPINQ